MEHLPDSGRESSERLVVWKAGGEHCRVVCSTQILEQIRRQCVQAARGPVPLGIGGAFLGEVSGGDFRIHQWHQIPCRYQRGPSFLLTKEEVAGLRDFLASLPQRDNNGGDCLIGWFVSHPYRGAEIRDSEISLHQRFFRSSDLFLLIEVHPDGALECTVHRGARPMQPVWRIVPSFISRRDRSLPETPTVVLSPPQPLDGSSQEENRDSLSHPRREPAPKGPLILALAALAVVIGLFFWSRPSKEPPPASPPPAPQPIATVSLRVQRQTGGFVIHWNPVEPSLAVARRVVLRITEGTVTTEHPLAEAVLRAGSFLHKSSAASLQVEMRADLPDGRVLSEKVLFGQPPPSSRRPAPPEK